MFACPGTLIIADVRRSRSIFGFKVQSSAVGNDFLMYDAQTAFGSLLCLLALTFSLSLFLYARECRHRNLFLCFMGQESCKRVHATYYYLPIGFVRSPRSQQSRRRVTNYATSYRVSSSRVTSSFSFSFFLDVTKSFPCAR